MISTKINRKKIGTDNAIKSIFIADINLDLLEENYNNYLK